MAFIRQHRSDWLNAMTSTLWDDFRSGACQLFVWEAFVSGSEKAYPPSHSGDAALAISAFLQVSSNNDNPTTRLAFVVRQRFRSLGRRSFGQVCRRISIC
jgi:hypothetical protein